MKVQLLCRKRKTKGTLYVGSRELKTEELFAGKHKKTVKHKYHKTHKKHMM